MPEFTIQSDLAVDSQTFWAGISMKSVNWELYPVIRMTAPDQWKSHPISQWEVGRELFKSWILLLGIIPVDLHSFKLEKVYEGSGFQECSSSLMNKEWRHKRTVVANPYGCMLTDHLAVVSRLPLVSGIFLPVYKFIFWNRHRRLRKKYGQQGS